MARYFGKLNSTKVDRETLQKEEAMIIALPA
jgi:hypothetical protein